MTTKTRIIWPDGTIDEGATHAAALDAARLDQWHDFTPRAFRRELARRALIFNGVRVSRRGSARRFAERLAAAGLFHVETVEDDS